MNLTDEQLGKLYDELIDTNSSLEKALEDIELTPDDYDMTDVQDRLVDLNLEMCVDCGYWQESGEFVDCDNEAHDSCTDCRPKDGEL
jgi:hypothetical protein